MSILVVQIILFILVFAGILLVPVGVPGTFIATAVVLGWRLVEGAGTFTFGHVILFLALAVSGEIVEALAGILGSKKYGASKAGMVGAFIGGTAGALAGSALLPVIGTLAGVFVGSFLLTSFFEMVFGKKKAGEGVKAGFGAFVGKIISISYKSSIGLAMLVVLVWRFWIT